MKTVIFHAEGMHCDGCASTLQSVLSTQSGVQEASVSFDDRQARVLFDASVTNENRLASAIHGAGFRVPEGCP